MVKKDEIRLSEEKETLFIPLYGKAMDYRSENSILNDIKASEIVDKIDIDFTKHERGFGERISAVRAKQYDQWTNDFIAKNKNAVMVHLGCGLDSRVLRTQPPSSVIWFDIDYPEVMDLRKRFYTETNRYRMVASSITVPDWLEAIPSDRPALIMAEGVFEYLSEEEVKTLLHRLTSYFPYGQIAFDVMSSYGVDKGNKNLRNAEEAVNICKWAVDDINDIDGLNPKLKRVEVVPLLKSSYIKKLPFGFRFAIGLITLFPKYKNGFRLLRYDF